MKPAMFTFAALTLVAAQAGAATLEQQFREQYAQPQPAWVGYTVPGVPGHGQICDYNSRGVRAPGPVHLEPPEQIQIMFRIQDSHVGKIRVISGDCELDSDSVPLRWLRDVRPAESIAFLSTFVGSDTDHVRDGAVTAIALHGDAAADDALERFAAAGQPESLRDKAIFWLGEARGRRGYETVRRIVTQDPSDRIREKAIFALSVSKEPQAVDAMIAVAHNDASTHVRGQALFWLAQKAGKKATAAITDALERDPDTEVKKKAVFALQQLPDGEGVPMLIQVARGNKNPAVRKQAMFWLGQSGDPRALAFFEEVLKP
ncbi:MAG TPA: HEAT repeat domain-containing protein [Bryobacteraceae bacterium]|nr:HEAT repeat domain-containing protein [Bryobacteraceae bacterium]